MCRFKDGQEVTADAHIKISRDSQSLEDYNLTVTIVKGADAGDYEARAENSLGTASTKSTVKVSSEYDLQILLLTDFSGHFPLPHHTCSRDELPTQLLLVCS